MMFLGYNVDLLWVDDFKFIDCCFLKKKFLEININN